MRGGIQLTSSEVLGNVIKIPAANQSGHYGWYGLFDGGHRSGQDFNNIGQVIKKNVVKFKFN